MELTNKEYASLLTIFYLGMLTEFGLIAGGGYNITSKGFDIAYDLYKTGYKLTKNEIKVCLNVIMEDTPPDTTIAILGLIYHLQKIGFDKMKKEITQLKTTHYV